MSLLDQAKPRKTGGGGILATLVGPPGCGKTSLACTFDKPFLIRTRGESAPKDVLNTPDSLAALGGRFKEGTRIWDDSELFDQLVALLQEDHEYKTAIIDSTTGLEDLFVSVIIDEAPVKQKTMNAALGGYGSAWDVVKGRHARVKNAAEALRDRKGMNVIFIAHQDVEKIELPDSDAFNSYSLQLHKKTAPVYVNNVDLVARIGQETLVRTDEGKTGKAMTTGTHKAIVTLSPNGVSKNRLGIERDLVLEKGVNPFTEFL